MDGQAGDVAADVFKRRGVGALDVFLRLGIDRERHVLDGRRALCRSDDDLAFRGGRGRRRRLVDGLGRLFLAGLRPGRRRDGDYASAGKQSAEMRMVIPHGLVIEWATLCRKGARLNPTKGRGEHFHVALLQC